ncbi:MAG: hypothetical protein V4593_08165 [Pseudomonadota bacterium]
MQDFTIQPDPNAGKKGRSFSAKLTSYVVADHMWDSGGGSNIRPIWAQFVGSDAELRPFATNLKLGRKAEPTQGRNRSPSDRLEFLRSANYQLAWQREVEGTILTVYHPDLFRLDPGMVDPAGVAFVMLVPQWWLAAQTLPAVGGADAARASLFAAYLDRRTRCPLVNDTAFYVQLLSAALEAGHAHEPDERRNPKHCHGSLAAEGLADAGIASALAFKADHETIEAFLAEQVGIYFGGADAAAQQEAA